MTALKVSALARLLLFFKPSIAYCMLRLAEIRTGDVVCDPMAGCGTIPIGYFAGLFFFNFKRAQFSGQMLVLLLQILSLAMS